MTELLIYTLFLLYSSAIHYGVQSVICVQLHSVCFEFQYVSVIKTCTKMNIIDVLIETKCMLPNKEPKLATQESEWKYYSHWCMGLS